MNENFIFKVNGKDVTTNEEKNLLDYLRDNLGLTSVKDGCKEGACGTCTILVDGKAMKSCILTTKKAVGKEIITVEGLSEKDKKAFAYAFIECGAVQCGFCIPGMVIAAKALFLRTLNPTPEEVKKALVGNICRCTGYVKIEQAILMAAEILREEREVPVRDCKGLIGSNTGRVDAEVKTLGTAKYARDYKVEGMYYGSAVRTKYPRARVLSIDYSEALKLDGVLGVLTAEDVPGNNYIGHLEFISDWQALIPVGEITRYIGDAVALVAAKDMKTLEEAKKLVKVEYEELPAMFTPEEAMAEGAPLIHKKERNILVREVLKRGNSEEAIKNSKYVVTNTYTNPATEHAYLEPESALAIPEGDGLRLYTSSQSIFDEQREVSRLLGLKREQVRVTSAYVGGGFGGKEDMSVQHHAALLAYVLKKPVQVTLTRQESINYSVKRHPMTIEMTTACDENGILTAMKAKIIADTGAYASLGGPVLQRACTHAAGPYNYQNIDIEGIAVYTNNPVAGAFRGFGVTQSAFAIEANINQLSELTGIDPWDIRYRNAIRPGQELPNGQIADNGTALVETLEAVKDDYYNNKIAGIACSMKNAGIGVGLEDIGRCRLTVEGGVVKVRTSAACIGQGIGTVALQMVCEASGLTTDKVVIETPDTHITPDSGTTTASRQTVFTGEAAKKAGLELRKLLETKTLEELEGWDYYAEYSGITDKMGSDKKNPVSHVAYGYATQVVILNEETGKVEKVVAAHDVGRAVNPKALEGQIEGGVVMGLGFALTEVMPIKEGVPQVKFRTLGLFRATNVPEIEPIIIEKNKADLAYGAKGVGEITVIPTAPAAQNAYYKFDGNFRTSLPLEHTFYKK